MIHEEKATLKKKITSQKKAIETARALGNDTEAMEKTLAQWEADLESLVENETETEKKEKRAKEIKEMQEAIDCALEVISSRDLGLHLGAQVRYFYQINPSTIHRETGQEMVESSLVFFTANQLYPHFHQMEKPLSRTVLRKLIEGQTVRCPVEKENGEIEYQDIKIPSRTYNKLGNSIHHPGEGYYNMLKLDKIRKPSGARVTECPLPLRALMMSLSGCRRVFENGQWRYTRLEAMRWLEKWIYGVTYAAVGEWTLGMPVIFGAGKVGKNSLFDIILPLILGKNLCFTSTWATIDGNFNAFKVGKVFMFIDEVPAKEDWNKLKNYTGSPSQFIKEKYGPELTIDNTIVYAVGSNETSYPLPVEDGKQMERVSPIKVNNGSLFASNVVELVGKTQVIQDLESVGLETQGLDDYGLGDLWLKKLPEKWTGDDIIQQFIDYLHTEYGGVKYQLSPLRGEDWDEIRGLRQAYYLQAANYVGDVRPDFITITELYEIYRAISNEQAGSRVSTRGLGNFIQQIKPELEALGYEEHLQRPVKTDSGGQGNGKRTRVFALPGVDLTNIQEDVRRYIGEQIMPGGKTQQYLRDPGSVVGRPGSDTHRGTKPTGAKNLRGESSFGIV